MNTSIEQSNYPEPGSARPNSASIATRSSTRLNPIRLGWGFGATGVVFYLGCILTMATVPREKAVIFFNSLLHGLNVDPVLKTPIPGSEVMLGLATTFILGWFAGALIAGFYNLGLPPSRSQPEGKQR